MRAGRLRHRITIQEKSVSRNTYGEEQISWVDVATVWGAVEPLRGDEFIESARAGAEVTTRIVIRYRSGIQPEMRVVYGSHVYDVVAVIDVDGRGRELQLMCREVL
jgi:SPP1 family predicted phage head-tail adaptor